MNSINAIIIQERLSELQLVSKVLRWASREGNIEDALRNQCIQYNLNFEVIKNLLDTNLRNKSVSIDDSMDTLDLVEMELSSDLMLDRRQLKRRDQYIQALHRVIRCFDEDTLTFATLRYIDLKKLKDIEQLMGITRHDSSKYINTISTQLSYVRAYTKSLFKQLSELQDWDKRIASIDDQIDSYRSGAKLSDWQLKRYHTAENIILELEKNKKRIEEEYKAALCKDIENTVECVKNAFKNNKIAMEPPENINRDTPIRAVRMSARLFNALASKNIEVLGDLEVYSRKQIGAFNHVGEKTLTELNTLIDIAGLEIRDN